MSVTFLLGCDTPVGCPAKHETVAANVRAARNDARAQGWSSRVEYRGTGQRQVTVDRCEQHPFESGSNEPAHITRRVPYEACSYQDQDFNTCGSQDTVHGDEDTRAVWEWCGHDQLGHRMARMFLRDGYTSVPRVLEADRRDLAAMRGFGALALARWDAFRTEGAS